MHALTSGVCFVRSSASISGRNAKEGNRTVTPLEPRAPIRKRRRVGTAGSPAAPQPLYLITFLVMAGILCLVNAALSRNFIIWGSVGTSLCIAAVVVYQRSKGRNAEHHW